MTSSGHAVRTAARGLDALGEIVELEPRPRGARPRAPRHRRRRCAAHAAWRTAVPVIVATARDDDAEVVRLLDAGADDYLVKPYSGAQLEARLRAVLRDAASPTRLAGPIVIGALRIDRAAARRRSTASRSTSPAGSSTCSRTSPSTRARSSAGVTCSRRSGDSPTAVTTRRSTCTSRGCAASSARPRASRATSTPCVVSA